MTFPADYVQFLCNIPADYVQFLLNIPADYVVESLYAIYHKRITAIVDFLLCMGSFWMMIVNLSSSSRPQIETLPRDGSVSDELFIYTLFNDSIVAARVELSIVCSQFFRNALYNSLAMASCTFW